MESPVAGGRKSSLPVFTFVKKYSLSCIKISLEKLKYLQDQETNNIYLRKVTTHTTKEYHFSECSVDLVSQLWILKSLSQVTDWPRSGSLLKKRFTISILSLKKQVTIIRVKTLTVCVLSNTANLLRATHTAVNPDALLPSDTKTKRSSTTSQPQYDLGVPDFKQPYRAYSSVFHMYMYFCIN